MRRNDLQTEELEIESLGQKAVNSALVLGLRRVVLQFIITGSNIILARILFPEVIGVFTILSFLVFLFSHLGDLGLGTALVQRGEEPSDKQLKGVFSVHLVLSILGAMALWILAPVIIKLYGEQLVANDVTMLRWLGLSLPLSVFGAVSSKMLERNLRYRRFAIGEIAQLVAGKAVAITLALAGFGVASLVFAELAMRLMGSIAYFMLNPWRMGFLIDRKALAKLFSFGLAFQMSAWLTLVNAAVTPVFVGNFPGPGGWTGPQAVGFITFAGGLAGLVRFFSEIVSQLTLPVISRAQHDKVRIKKAVEKALEVVAFSSFGLAVLLITLGNEIIAIIYTDKWLPALSVLRLFSVQGIGTAISLILLNTLLALGASKTYLKMNAFWAVLQWALAVPLVLKLGFVGMGWASVVGAATSVAMPWYILKRRVRFEFLRMFFKMVGVALLSTLLIYFLKMRITVDNIWNLILVGGVSTMIYGSVLYLVMRKTVESSMSYLWKLLKRRK